MQLIATKGLADCSSGLNQNCFGQLCEKLSSIDCSHDSDYYWVMRMYVATSKSTYVDGRRY
jgi:hypothetical protein